MCRESSGANRPVYGRVKEIGEVGRMVANGRNEPTIIYKREIPRPSDRPALAAFSTGPVPPSLASVARPLRPALFGRRHESERCGATPSLSASELWRSRFARELAFVSCGMCYERQVKQTLASRMKATFTILTALLTFTAVVNAEEPFHVYAPSPGTKQLWVIAAKPSANGIDLSEESKVDLGFQAGTIALHPSKPSLYVGAGGGTLDNVSAATVSLNPSGGVASHQLFKLKHGTAYLSTDRSGKFLLSASYGSGAIDVYGLDDAGIPTNWIAGRDEGRKEAHCILPSPDNKYLYIPYVKDNNAILQYRFNATTGSLDPMEPANALPPAGTGPRHIAYHPTLAVVYFSNEQHLGVSVYDRDTEGRLNFRNVCDAVTADESKEGISSSDIVITPDGRFLFAGIRGHRRDFDWITRYQIGGNGDISMIGRTPADKIPWGFTLSPKAEFLFVTAYDGATITAYTVGKDGSLEKAASIPCDKGISDIVAR